MLTEQPRNHPRGLLDLDKPRWPLGSHGPRQTRRSANHATNHGNHANHQPHRPPPLKGGGCGNPAGGNT